MGRKLVLIIIGVVVLLALGGGGIAAYLLLFAKKPTAEMQEDEPPPAPVRRPAFIPLDPFSVWVEPEGQKPREVIVIFHLEASPDNVPQINAKMPILRDRYIRELLKMGSIPVPVRFEAKDLTDLKARLRGPTEEVMGKGVVTQVLLLNIIAPLK